MKRLITLAFSLMMVVAVMAADKATAYFTVTPGMTCQNCENKIKTNLRYEKGVKEITTSLGDQVVTVAYDPAKTNVEKLQAAFKKIGYTASVTAAPKGTKGAKCIKGVKCDKEVKCAKDAKCEKAAKCDKAMKLDKNINCDKATKCTKDTKCAKDTKCTKDHKCAKDHKCSKDHKDGKCKDGKCKDGKCDKAKADCCKK